MNDPARLNPMTGPLTNSTTAQAADLAPLARRLAAALLVSLLALVATVAVPPIELDSGLALVAWAISASGGRAGTPIMLVLGVAWLVSTGSYSVSRRVLAVVVLAGLVGVLGAAAWGNEHVLKPAVGAARPNILELARLGVIPSADEFYRMGDKDRRTRELRSLFATEPAASLLPDLHPWVREHWLHETGYSFPSGHTLATVTLATCFTLLGLRLRGRPSWLVWGFLPWAILVGWSRYLLRVHSTADITCGGLIGVVLGFLAAWVVLGWLNRRSTRNQTLKDHLGPTTI